MVTRKPKHMLSLVTTTDKKLGASRTTLSTVHSGDWDDQQQQQPPPAPQQQQQGSNRGDPLDGVGGGYDPYRYPTVEPSTPSAPDPWMIVSGAGGGSSSSSSYPYVPTPVQARQQQLQTLPTLQLLDRYADTDPVLDVEIAQQIRMELPRRLRNATKWNLVYSSDQHGISMSTLYHRCKGRGPIVLAIKDTTDAIFGAYVSEAFKTNLSYYGTGECFLWNVTTLIQQSGSPTLSTAAPTGIKTTPLPSPGAAVQSPPSSAGSSRSSSGGIVPTTATQVSLMADRRQELFRAMREGVLGVGRRSPSPARPLVSPSSSTAGVSAAGAAAADALRAPQPVAYSPIGSPRLSPLDPLYVGVTHGTPSSSTAATAGNSPPPSLTTEFSTSSTPVSMSSSSTPLPTATVGGGTGVGAQRTGGATTATATPPSSSPRKGKRAPRPKVVQFWKWTGRNDYMVLSEAGFIGLGGGEGRFGLWIHADLEHGHSARCSTFDNEPLALACHRPIRAGAGAGAGAGDRIDGSGLGGGNGDSHRTTPTPTPAGDASPKSDSDREKFYCQTIEIWAVNL
ncbi:oxidation resistance protein 1 [Actinomortierella ambigua]|nr:oxidation resistance protein 1 [Actinomortierella ambigua]